MPNVQHTPTPYKVHESDRPYSGPLIESIPDLKTGRLGEVIAECERIPLMWQNAEFLVLAANNYDLLLKAFSLMNPTERLSLFHRDATETTEEYLPRMAAIQAMLFEVEAAESGFESSAKAHASFFSHRVNNFDPVVESLEEMLADQLQLNEHDMHHGCRMGPRDALHDRPKPRGASRRGERTSSLPGKAGNTLGASLTSLSMPLRTRCSNALNNK